jgi:hypothetical protein
MWQHEPCFFGWVKGHKPKRMAKDYPPSVWSMPTTKPGETTDHPTEKPVELFAIPIRQHTKRGDLWYEPFAGSGTQLVAAESLGRMCYAMELSPAFVPTQIVSCERTPWGNDRSVWFLSNPLGPPPAVPMQAVP